MDGTPKDKKQADASPNYAMIKAAVRDVLINDLEIDREGLRNIAREYVENSVERYINAIFQNGNMKGFVRAIINKEMTNNQWSPDAFKILVSNAAKEEMAKFVDERLEFRIIPEFEKP